MCVFTTRSLTKGQTNYDAKLKEGDDGLW
jgi:hypothetical protein